MNKIFNSIIESAPPANRWAITLITILFLFSLGAKADGVATFSTDGDGNKYVCMPTTGTSKLEVGDTVKSFLIYGDNYTDYYSKNSDGYLQISVPDGYRIELSGSIRMNRNDAYLSVYDGLSTESTILLDKKTAPEYNGQLYSIGTIQSSAKNMMLYFHSGDWGTYMGGLFLTATLFKDQANDINVNTSDGGSITVDKQSAKVGESVTLSVLPQEGYYLNDLTVTYEDSKKVDVSDCLWYTGKNTATFTMPSSAATITPTFVTVDNVSVNLPLNGTKDISVPGKTIKVYDDGGPNAPYGSPCNGYIHLKASDGKKFVLSGNSGLYYKDSLIIYDGANISTPKILEISNSWKKNLLTPSFHLDQTYLYI